ncbi:MAG: ATP-binding protein [Bacteroidota bacterium]|nr:ATP-binding protein [Bacteroidota bacterium]
MISRLILKQLTDRLGKGKAILLVGPRQVGKSTLLKSLQKEQDQETLLLNCDEPDIRQMLENVTSDQLKAMIGKNTLLLIDEAQKVENIGLTLKLIVDNIKQVQVIATGSSAFELRNKTNEPLTGRKYEFNLFPLSIAEMVAHHSQLTENRMLERRLIYGLYPEIVNDLGSEQENLLELINSYLYKDILSFQNIRKPDVLEKLLTGLALQMGQEVSYNELGQLIGVDKATIEKYIELLEKCFVVFRLSSFNRNLRNELKKSRKIYFYDNGVRNAILNNFAPLALRQDVGALWENFMVSERMKQNSYNRDYRKNYFWRTQTQQEIDLLEEKDGVLYAFEFKWNESKKSKLPQTFADAYPEHRFDVITPANYIDFLTTPI